MEMKNIKAERQAQPEPAMRATIRLSPNLHSHCFHSFAHSTRASEACRAFLLPPPEFAEDAIVGEVGFDRTDVFFDEATLFLREGLLSFGPGPARFLHALIRYCSSRRIVNAPFLNNIRLERQGTNDAVQFLIDH